MNIKELAELAIERINNTTVDEFEQMLIKHSYGYIPIRKEHIKNLDKDTTMGSIIKEES